MSRDLILSILTLKMNTFIFPTREHPIKFLEDEFSIPKQVLIFFLNCRHSIERQHINGSKREVVVSKGLIYVEGIAFDYLGHNIYWADEGSAVIKVAKVSNSTMVKTIVSGNLFQPRSLAIDHKHRWLFYFFFEFLKKKKLS